MKGSQDEMNRQTKDLQFEMAQLATYGNKIEDLHNRIIDSEQNI